MRHLQAHPVRLRVQQRQVRQHLMQLILLMQHLQAHQVHLQVRRLQVHPHLTQQ